MSFTDKIGQTGNEGDAVLTPVIDERGVAQLEVARVIEVVTRAPNPFASTLSVRTCSDSGDVRIFEPEEVAVIPGR